MLEDSSHSLFEIDSLEADKSINVQIIQLNFLKFDPKISIFVLRKILKSLNFLRVQQKLLHDFHLLLE